MYDIGKIKKYILYLKKECGLYPTLHPIKKESLILTSELINFNIHDNPYCTYLKSFPHVWRHCVERQGKVLDKCREGSFCGSCFAGCKEFVYPISNGKETVGFISVGGYRTESHDGYLRETAKKYSIPTGELRKIYSTLREAPSKEEIDTLILPLCDMLELAYLKSESDSAPDEDFADRVLRYVKRYHTCDITLDDLCEHFNCSRFYISRKIGKRTGLTFREYLNGLRIDDAKSLLEHSSLCVSEISFAVGFNDSNYFSAVFKKYTGTSPLSYRKSIGKNSKKP